MWQAGRAYGTDAIRCQIEDQGAVLKHPVQAHAALESPLQFRPDTETGSGKGRPFDPVVQRQRGSCGWIGRA